MPRSTSDTHIHPGTQEERSSPLGKRVTKGQHFAPALDSGHGDARGDARGGIGIGDTRPRTSKLRGAHGLHRDDREVRIKDDMAAGEQNRGGGGGGEGDDDERDWDSRASQSAAGDGDDHEAATAGGGGSGGGGGGGGVDLSAMDSDFKIFPRRKGGQSKKCAESAPVIITAELLQMCFDMPLVQAAKKLGICATALKKVCRKLGIHKWPYKEMKPSLSLGRQGDGDGAGLPGGAPSPRAAGSASTPRRELHSKEWSSRNAGRKGGSQEFSDMSPPETGRRHTARAAGGAGAAAEARGGRVGNGGGHATPLHATSAGTFLQSVSKWPGGLQSPRSESGLAGIGAVTPERKKVRGCLCIHCRSARASAHHAASFSSS